MQDENIILLGRLDSGAYEIIDPLELESDDERCWGLNNLVHKSESKARSMPLAWTLAGL